MGTASMPNVVRKLLWALKILYLPEVFRAVFTGPYTVKFPFGETLDTGSYRGAAVWDKDVCIGCGACCEVCPTGAIAMVDDVEADPPVRRFTLDYGRCIFCGHCHYNCTTDDGIYQTTDWDLATFDPTEARTGVEKELLLCEKCGGVISARDHVRWVARKLGPKVYSNPSLAITLEGAVVPLHSGPREEGRPTGRSDIMRVICPHCRRVVVLTEIS
jgi:hydrogenase-4 component H